MKFLNLFSFLTTLLYILSGSPSLSFAEEKTITLSTYYPAPFGDFENLRSNTIECFGVLTGVLPGVTPPRSLDHIKWLGIHKSVRILNQLAAPYNEEVQIAPSDIKDYIEIDAHSHQMLFSAKQNAGIFFLDPRSGLHFNYSDNLDQRFLSLRNAGDIYIQPGVSLEEEAKGEFIDDDLDGSVFVMGRIFVDGVGHFQKVSTASIRTQSSQIVSDMRLKTNIQSLSPEESLKLLHQLNPVQFSWINQEDHTQLGFIAQEVEQVAPQLVQEEEGLKAISYIEIIPLLVQAVKTQQEEIERLKKQLKTSE